MENPKIELLTNTETVELHGEDKLSGITIRDRQSGATRQSVATSRRRWRWPTP